MKVLWCGDAVVNSGFSVVTHNVCKYLSQKCDLVVYGICYDGLTPNPHSYTIYPACSGGDVYGFKHFREVVEKVEPDVVVLFNDDHVIKFYLQIMSEFTDVKRVIIFPVNLLPLNKDTLLFFSIVGVSEALVYTNFSRKEISKINPNLSSTVMYHGVDHSVFYPIQEAKKHLNLDRFFIVGNINVNDYRKRMDLFVKAFSEFAKNKEDVKCLIHTNKSATYDLTAIARRYGVGNKLILSSGVAEFDKINFLYNLMDVVVTTSVGEGFGLSLLEGAACGKPVVCPAIGNLMDVWGDSAEFIKLIKKTESVPNTSFEGEVIDTGDLVAKLNKLYKNEEFRKERGVAAYNRSYNDVFDWEHVATKVFEVIMRASKDRVYVIE